MAARKPTPKALEIMKTAALCGSVRLSGAMPRTVAASPYLAAVRRSGDSFAVLTDAGAEHLRSAFRMHVEKNDDGEWMRMSPSLDVKDGAIIRWTGGLRPVYFRVEVSASKDYPWSKIRVTKDGVPIRGARRTWERRFSSAHWVVVRTNGASLGEIEQARKDRETLLWAARDSMKKINAAEQAADGELLAEHVSDLAMTVEVLADNVEKFGALGRPSRKAR